MNSKNDLPNGTPLVAVRGFSLQLEERSSLGWICISCTSQDLDTPFRNILLSIMYLYRLLTTPRSWFDPRQIFVGFLVDKVAMVDIFYLSASVFPPVIIILPMFRLCSLFVYHRRPRGTRWRSWLRHCATSRKVAGSIPDGVSGIFHWHNPSGRTTALGSTQPLTEMSTRNICWGVKAAGA